MDAKEYFESKSGGVKIDNDTIHWHSKFVVKMMQEYANHVAEEKCKEQKEICASVVYLSVDVEQGDEAGIKNDIRRAKLATDK